jgi:hypothetical protein
MNQSTYNIIFKPNVAMNDKLSSFVFWESRFQILAQWPAVMNEIGFRFPHFREEDAGEQRFN